MKNIILSKIMILSSLFLTPQLGQAADFSVSFDIHPGIVVAYAGTTCPQGYLKADGSIVSRSTQSRLFAAIGVAHGAGDGSTTFHLPDYRGRFLRGVDETAGRDGDKASRTAMNSGGNTGNLVGSVQGDAIRNMTGEFHVLGYGGSTGSHMIIEQKTGVFEGSLANGSINNRDAYSTAYNTNYSIGSGARFDASNVVPTGSDNRPVNAYVNYCIKN